MWDKLTDLVKTERPVTLAMLACIGLALANLTREIGDLRHEQWTIADENRLAIRQERELRAFARRLGHDWDAESKWPEPWEVVRERITQ